MTHTSAPSGPIRTLRPLQQITVRIAGHDHLAQDPLNPVAQDILDALNTQLD